MFDCSGSLHHKNFKDSLAMFPRKNVIYMKKVQKIGLIER